jgi:hypothetical protein
MDENSEHKSYQVDVKVIKINWLFNEDGKVGY